MGDVIVVNEHTDDSEEIYNVDSCSSPEPSHDDPGNVQVSVVFAEEELRVTKSDDIDYIKSLLKKFLEDPENGDITMDTSVMFPPQKFKGQDENFSPVLVRNKNTYKTLSPTSMPSCTWT